MDLQQLQKEIHTTARQKGWWETERPVGDIIANIHAELAEAWEEYRNGMPLNDVYYCEGPPHYDRISKGLGKTALAGPPMKPEGFCVELADAIIRILDYFEYLGVDAGEVIAEKMAYNATREFRHGGKLA